MAVQKLFEKMDRGSDGDSPHSLNLFVSLSIFI